MNLSYLNKNREEEEFVLHGFNLVVLALVLCVFVTTKLVSGWFLTLLWCYELFSLLVCPLPTHLPQGAFKQSMWNMGGW